MHHTKVVMKNGRIFWGSLWGWRPTEGWFSIADDESPDRIMLADVESAIEHGQRVGINEDGITPRIEDVDLLQKAKRKQS